MARSRQVRWTSRQTDRSRQTKENENTDGSMSAADGRQQREMEPHDSSLSHCAHTVQKPLVVDNYHQRDVISACSPWTTNRSRFLGFYWPIPAQTCLDKPRIGVQRRVLRQRADPTRFKHPRPEHKMGDSKSSIPATGLTRWATTTSHASTAKSKDKIISHQFFAVTVIFSLGTISGVARQPSVKHGILAPQ